MRISVIGLGKLGAPLAAILGSKGFAVSGVDINPKVVAEMRTGRAPVPEPGLQELLNGLNAPIDATADLSASVVGSQVSFVLVPTPSCADGTYSSAAVETIVRKIGEILRDNDDYHLVVIASTVMPGTMNEVIRKVLEDAAGCTLGDRIGLCYSPQFAALGSVIANMARPDFILIGESDAKAGGELEKLFQKMCTGQPVIQRMNFVNAELTKIAINGFVTTKISYANMLSELCDRLPGADAAVVTGALGCDSRIGHKFLFPALGYGGPCFPRDNVALASMANALGACADLAEATDRVNRRQVERVVARVRERLSGGTVGILGLAYKENTSVCEESQGVAIALALADAGYRVLVSDPEALEAAILSLDGKAEPVRDIVECVQRADLLIIATPWACFNNLPRVAFQRDGHNIPVIDCWRLLDPQRLAEDIDLIYLGRAALIEGAGVGEIARG